MAKFVDIRSYTRTPSYVAEIPLIYVTDRIREFVEEDGLQMEPDFQRGHVWDEEKQIAYLEHLLRGGKGSHQIRFNHPGWMSSWEGDFVLVDGLQRLTAIMRFFGNEIPACGNYLKDYEDRVPTNITMSFMINDLKTRAEVLQWYIEINAGGVVHTEEEIQKVRDLLALETETN